MTEPESTEDETTDETTTEDESTEDDADTFPRSYVEKLRKEAGDNRAALSTANETLAATQERLHGLLVAGTGRLQDPTDLAFDAAHLEDDESLSNSLDDLLARKPHLASRRVRGDVGQGAGEPTTRVNLAGMLSARA